MKKQVHKIIVGSNFAFIDAHDAHLVREYRWHPGGTGNRYAAASLSGTTVYMHRVVMGAGPDDVVDHIDGNPLNNLRSNLRLVSRSQNSANLTTTNNPTGFRGVFFFPLKGKHQARVTCEGSVYRGPYRKRAKDAALDFDKMARGLFGNHATYNYPKDGERGVIAAGGRHE